MNNSYKTTADIRNKLTPFCNLIAMLETSCQEYHHDHEVHKLIQQEIEQCKKSIEYLQEDKTESEKDQSIYIEMKLGNIKYIDKNGNEHECEISAELSDREHERSQIYYQLLYSRIDLIAMCITAIILIGILALMFIGVINPHDLKPWHSVLLIILVSLGAHLAAKTFIK